MSDRFGKDKNKSTDANFFPGNTDDEKISRLCIKFTKITGSVNSFKKSQTQVLLDKENELLEKWKKIWDNVSNRWTKKW